jgi:hypothetical protein
MSKRRLSISNKRSMQWRLLKANNEHCELLTMFPCRFEIENEIVMIPFIHNEEPFFLRIYCFSSLLLSSFCNCRARSLVSMNSIVRYYLSFTVYYYFVRVNRFHNVVIGFCIALPLEYKRSSISNALGRHVGSKADCIVDDRSIC